MPRNYPAPFLSLRPCFLLYSAQAQFGGGFDTGMAGGFQATDMPVDNSSPAGQVCAFAWPDTALARTAKPTHCLGTGLQAKGNKDRQSLIPVTIKQLKNAPAMTSGEQGFQLDGRDLYQVTICGLIMNADEQSTNLQYTIDDGTDTIMVKMWVDADADDAFQERRAHWKEGVVVRVIGQLRSFNNTKSLVAYSMQPITDFNEYTFHFIEVVHTHLRHTKGPVPMDAPAAGYAAPSAMGGAPTAMGGYQQAAPMAPQQSLSDLVLKFFQSKGEASDAGVTIHDASNALAANGVAPEQVRNIVEELVNEGHLYSTIDDDHYKATA